MPISKDVDGTIVMTPPDRKDLFDQTGVAHNGQFAICDKRDLLKQIKFDPSAQSTNTTVTFASGPSSSDIVLTLPTTSGTLSTAAGGASFKTIQPPLGTSPTATGPTDTLTLTSSDSSVTITGNSTTDTIDLKASGGITALTGDVTASGTGSVAATVATVGGSAAADVHTAELAANAATSSNTVSTIVKRDASGNFSAGAVTCTSLKASNQGTASVCAVQVANFANTGMFVSNLDGSNNPRTLNFTVNGTQVLFFDLNTGNGNPYLQNIHRINGPDGSSSQPAFAFSNDGSTGMYRAGAGLLGLGVSNGLRFQLSAGQASFNCGQLWNNTQLSASATTAIAEHVIGVDTTSAPVTLTLLAKASTNGSTTKAFIHIIKDIGGNAGTNNITITPNGTDTIDGVNASKTINTAYGVLRLYCNGSGWFTI